MALSPALRFALACLCFLAVSLVLFLLSSRYVVVYDEGIALTGAMRVMAGQVPHRDFYYNYGAGTLYFLAGLFRVFGTSVLVERLQGVVTSSLLILSVYWVSRRYCARWIALGAAVLAGLWTATDLIQGFLPAAICLLTLWSTWLLVPERTPHSRWRAFGAGMVVALLFLLRYELGIALAFSHLTALVLFALLTSRRASEQVRRIAEVWWPYAAGFLVVVIGPAIAYLRVAPLHDLLYDVFLFQAKYYRMARGLPLPRLSFDTLADCVVYVVPIAIGLAVYFIARGVRAHRQENRAALPSWLCLLIAYCIPAAIYYVKGIVRTSAGQMFPCTILCLVMLALITQQARKPRSGAMMLCVALALIFAILGCWGLQRKLLWEKNTRSSTLKWIVAPAKQPPFPPLRNWCQDGAPITRGFCFLLDENRIQVIRYIKSHTQPQDMLYVGLSHHDRIFESDNITYFATERLPATKWSHFDPFLQNRADIQLEMIQDLEKNQPPYVVLDAEFEHVFEPNGSAVSTHVYLLDDYIHSHYTPVVAFGPMTILKRNSLP